MNRATPPGLVCPITTTIVATAVPNKAAIDASHDEVVPPAVLPLSTAHSCCAAGILSSDGPSAVKTSRNTPVAQPKLRSPRHRGGNLLRVASSAPLLYPCRVGRFFFGERTKASAPIPVSVALQRVVHSPAFGALQPADQIQIPERIGSAVREYYFLRSLVLITPKPCGSTTPHSSN